MSGFQLAQILKESNATKHIPIIFLTASDLHEGDLSLGYAQGAVDYLIRPFEVDMLKAKVAVFVDIFVKNEQLRQQAECLQEAERKASDRAAALEESNRELVRLNTALKEADRLKDDFLSVVSHELRTPLNFITGFTSLVMEGDAGTVTPQQRDFLSRVLHGADRMLMLVNDLLDFARIRSGRFQLEAAPTELGPLIDSVCETMRPVAEEKAIRIEREVQTSCLPEIDGSRVGQVLGNLISNAIKFGERNGSIRVHAR